MIVFVTGATAGFGITVARRFAADGAKIVALGRRQERLEALVGELGADRAYSIAADIRDKAALERHIAELPDAFKDIDVLVNNAGLALGLSAAQVSSLEDWEQMVDTNIKGVLYVTHMLLPGMIARGRGHIINLGSTAGEYPYPGGNVYGASKAFLHQFSNNLRSDLLGTPIRVTNIEPGLVGGTEFSVVRLGGQAAADKVYAGTEPLTADDIAEAICWAAMLPRHVNINHIQMMPVCQAAGPLAIHRTVPQQILP